jgi:trk system potassium uptake protein
LLDGVVNGLATVSTGGFSPSDSSFAKYPGAAEYAGALFMAMSSLPFILYVQLMRGHHRPLLQDPQVAGFLSALLVAVWGVSLWQTLTSGMGLEQAFRESLFNLTSIMSGTGFFSGSFSGWEGPALIVAFALGLSGGCSGSSSGGLSVFRVQLAFVALASQIRMIQSPSRIVPIRYDGRTVAPDVMDALMLYVTGYILLLGVMTILMTVVGVDAYSAVIGVWQSLGNVGYGLGPLVAATGTFVEYPDPAKWIMTASMLLGRLGLLTMVVVVLPRFWRG